MQIPVTLTLRLLKSPKPPHHWDAAQVSAPVSALNENATTTVPNEFYPDSFATRFISLPRPYHQHDAQNPRFRFMVLVTLAATT